ncbi:MAG: glycosyltransferase family 2 protein [Xanthomonadales bacterium]|nr:glycosyltransferase family 2 protein [Xanthomonadales bacterium]
MKISGFTIIRDGVRLGYPFVESIRSVLPLCNEFFVAVGEGTDETLDVLRTIDDPRLHLVQTRWNERSTQHGFVIAQQKMLAQYHCTGDWAFYLEVDEVIHERDLEPLRAAMAQYLPRRDIEALVFDYHHFYGDCHHVNVSPAAYRRAARIIRNDIRSMALDGLYWSVIRDRTWYGKRNKRRLRYPRAAALNIPIYHYGNARRAAALAEKAETGRRYWGGKLVFHERYGDIDPRAIRAFEGAHPAVMKDWIERHANQSFRFNPDHKLTRRERKHRIVMALEQWLGFEASKKHFKIVEEYAPGSE